MTDPNELLATCRKLQEGLTRSHEHFEKWEKLQDAWENAARDNASALLDKFLPVLTALLAGIAYALLEHKTHPGWALNCLRIGGISLTLTVLIIFVRAYLEPSLAFGAREQLLAVKDGERPPRQWWYLRHYERLEAIRIITTLVLGVAGIVLAIIAVLIESGAAVPKAS